MPRGRSLLLALAGLAAGLTGVWLAAASSAEPAAAQAADPPAAAVEPPLSPQAALAAFQVDSALRVELVAAEPLIESPVAVAFDTRGRMFVAENRGYPTGPEDAGRIALLEDADHDGTFDRRREFAEGLSYPNGLMPWRDGLLVTCAPDVLFLRDTDGDGRSDEREVLLTGFSTAGSTQLRASHPQLGLDGWIYVTGGLSGGKVTSPKNPDHPAVEFGRADFRFLPDLSKFEAINGGGQFGMSFDDFGHRFICYNRVQIQHVVLPDQYLTRNPHLAATGTVQDCPAEMEAEPLANHGAAARLHPIGRNITTADSHAGTFTAACGLLIYRSSELPQMFRGGAFSCDPTGNLVHFDRLEPAGATFIARPLAGNREALASRDDWFRPCNLAEGPDGALYICDMYRKTIEHPDYLPPEIRKHTDFESGKGMGRIWRVVNADSNVRLNVHSAVINSPPGTKPWEAMRGRDAWRRATGYRIALERGDVRQTELRCATTRLQEPASAAIALRVLDAYGALETQVLCNAAYAAAPGVREQVIQMVESRLAKEPKLVEEVARFADDPDARVRFQCALTLGESQDGAMLEPLAKIALADSGDRWTRLAVLSSLGGRELDFLPRYAALLASTPAGEGSGQFLSELGRLIGASLPPSDWAAALHTVVEAVRARPFQDQAACIAGLSDALRMRRAGASGSALQEVIAQQKDAAGDADRRFFDTLFVEAEQRAVDRSQPAELRAAAVNLLADADAAAIGELLLALVDAHEPAAVQMAAVRALKNLDDPAIAGRLVETERFRSYSPPLREAVLAAMLAQPRLLPALFDAVESGAVPVGTIDSLRRKQLASHRDPAIRERAAKVFAASAVGNRAGVYEDYKSVLGLTGHAENGKRVFTKTCANCHRLDREGTPVGPDLFGIRTQPKEAILLHILIPEFEITPGFGAYLVETTDGRTLAGLLVGETATQVTLRAALGREESVLRSDIESLSLSKLSLMPQELEKAISRQEMADLLAYLKGEAP